MTLKEFYKRARRVQWIVRPDGMIRTKNALSATDVIGSDAPRAHLCPLAYVLRSWGTYNKELPEAAAKNIAYRADGLFGWRGRYRLKRALGMCK
jgi:hypothetical protein